MSSEIVIAERLGPLLRITLNRPDKANALNRAMAQRLLDLCEASRRDPQLRAVVFTGAGERTFCAGADLSEIALGGIDRDNSIWSEVPQAVAELEILSIAAINGACIGGGLTLALACDLRISVPEAQFGYPVLRNKLVPFKTDCDRLRALVGPARSSVLLLAGERVAATEARDWGLVDRIVARDYLDEVCRNFCAGACAAEREQLAAIKRLCRPGPT